MITVYYVLTVDDGQGEPEVFELFVANFPFFTTFVSLQTNTLVTLEIWRLILLKG